MNRMHTFIDPTSTSQLLNNLSLAIDETKLVRTINSMRHDIYKIESASGPSKRTRYLRQEITRLEAKLENVRHQVRLSEL